MKRFTQRIAIIGMTLLVTAAAHAAIVIPSNTPILYLSNRGGDTASSVPYAFNANTGALLGTFDVPGGGVTINTTSGMEIGPDGKLYIAQQDSRNVLRYNLDGSNPEQVVAPGAGPNAEYDGIAFAPNGDMLVTYSGGVWKFDGPSYTTGSQFVAQTGVQFGIDLGSDGKFYVADRTNDLIRIYNDDGTTAGTYSITGPAALQFAPDDSFLYVATGGAAQDLQRIAFDGATLGAATMMLDTSTGNRVGQMSFLNANTMFVPNGTGDNAARWISNVLDNNDFADKGTGLPTFASTVFVPIPEPSTIGLLVCAAILLVPKVRRRSST